MAKFDWQLNFLSVHTCKAKEKGNGMEARALAKMEKVTFAIP